MNRILSDRFENVVQKSDKENFIKLRRSNFPSSNHIVLNELMAFNYPDSVDNIESGEAKLDDRTYSLFLLINDVHPLYKLKPKTYNVHPEQARPLCIQPPNDGREIKKYRFHADQMNKNEMSLLLGLSGKKSIYQYESNRKKPSTQCWTLFLLIIGQHQHFELIERYI